MATFGTYATENFVGHATITDSYVAGYQKNGITIDGVGTTATVHDNEVQGGSRTGAISAQIAQNGIQLSRGATARIYDNLVYNNSYTWSSFASAGGILVFGGCGDPLVTNVTIHDNHLFNNDVGLYINNYSADPNCTAPAATPTNIRIIVDTPLAKAEVYRCVARVILFHKYGVLPITQRA